MVNKRVKNVSDTLHYIAEDDMFRTYLLFQFLANAGYFIWYAYFRR